jgi:thiol-disulfide isomerase/thioredoxin
MPAKKVAILILVLAGIAGTIWYLESGKPEQGSAPVINLNQNSLMKQAKYESAKEITTPDGFINTEPLKLADLIGQKVVLLDFWTYSCINCQRTTPYLNAWYEKYRDSGLEIVGVHTPEFEFEKEYDNVKRAVEQFDIKFPVVLDNDYSTWQAYNNRYWPRKYLIDIDGYIVYDHIGEGGYEETELEIKKALAERAARLGEAVALDDETVQVAAEKSDQVGSPEVYFGAGRNSLLASGQPGQVGRQTFLVPSQVELNKLYLVGEWDISQEYSEAVSAGSEVIFKFRAGKVFMVASSDTPKTVQVYQDGTLVKEVMVNDEQLYRLIENQSASEHALRLVIPPGVRLYTFTFG